MLYLKAGIKTAESCGRCILRLQKERNIRGMKLQKSLLIKM